MRWNPPPIWSRPYPRSSPCGTARRADQTHNYGHEKIEYFASGIEGGLIVFAAGLIAWTAVGRFWDPVMPESLGIGLTVVTLASTINLGVSYRLVRLGRRMESIVLEADGQHLLTDLWTTVAVGIGLLLVVWTRQPWLDPLLALLVAFLLVPGDYPVARAHNREMAIGTAIRQIIPGIEITAHIEPVEEPLAWNDQLAKAQPHRASS